MLKQRYVGYCVAALVTLCMMGLWFTGCDWFDDDESPQSITQSKFVLTMDTDGDGLTIFKITGSTGELTYVDNAVLYTDARPTMMALHPTRRFAYIVNSNAGGVLGWNGLATIGAYEYNPSTSEGTEIAGSPFIPSTQPNATLINMAITPDGKYLYATDQNDYQIVAFAIADNGALTEIADSPFSASDTHGIAMHPNGGFLFDGDEGGDIRSWSIADNGALTETPDSPYSGSGAQVWLAVTPNGKFLYATGTFNGVDGVSIADNGALTQLSGFPVDNTSSLEAKGLVILPSGKFLYTANFADNSVSAYGIADNGALTAVAGEPFAAGYRPKSVSATRNGKFLYCANYGDNTVSAFSVNTSTGVLTSIATYPTAGAGPKFVTTSP